MGTNSNLTPDPSDRQTPELTPAVREYKIRHLKSQAENHRRRYAILMREANLIADELDRIAREIAALNAADAGSHDAPKARTVYVDDQGWFDRGMDAYKNGSNLVDVLRNVTNEDERKQIADGYEYAKLHSHDAPKTEGGE